MLTSVQALWGIRRTTSRRLCLCGVSVLCLRGHSVLHCSRERHHWPTL